jgi:cellulose synthase/poly-beta-1,6-N-acetylglucosamine synthase-like glycosyltransferase
MVYLFYNGVLFAMFMGIPFFHLFLGIIAGYYWAKYLINHKKITDYKREIRRISLLTSIVIGIVCMFSALVALINKSTIGDLKLMFNLPFDISRPMLIAFIVTGGILMIIVQYMLVKVTMKKTLQIN